MSLPAHAPKADDLERRPVVDALSRGTKFAGLIWTQIGVFFVFVCVLNGFAAIVLPVARVLAPVMNS